MHIIGMEPLTSEEAAGGSSPQASLIQDMVDVRDSCIRLAGHRCYREYPKDWVLRQIEKLADPIALHENRALPIQYTSHVVLRQVCDRYGVLPSIRFGKLMHDDSCK